MSPDAFFAHEYLGIVDATTVSVGVSLVFVVPALLLSTAIWISFDTSHGEVCCSLSGLFLWFRASETTRVFGRMHAGACRTYLACGNLPFEPN